MEETDNKMKQEWEERGSDVLQMLSMDERILSDLRRRCRRKRGRGRGRERAMLQQIASFLRPSQKANKFLRDNLLCTYPGNTPRTPPQSVNYTQGTRGPPRTIVQCTRAPGWQDCMRNFKTMKKSIVLCVNVEHSALCGRSVPRLHPTRQRPRR